MTLRARSLLRRLRYAAPPLALVVFDQALTLALPPGLSATHISVPARRDRLLLLVAFAEALLTLLGAAAESLGLDRKLKVNTVTKRTHSLFRQGSYWYRAIPAMREERLRDLMTAFENTLSHHAVFRGIFGAI